MLLFTPSWYSTGIAKGVTVIIWIGSIAVGTACLVTAVPPTSNSTSTSECVATFTPTMTAVSTCYSFVFPGIIITGCSLGILCTRMNKVRYRSRSGSVSVNR